MITSMFLAKAFSIYLFIMSVAVFMNGSHLKSVIKDLVSSPAILAQSGALMVIVGITLVLNHHVWTPDWHGLVTLLSWIILVKGTVRLAFPDVAKDMLNKCSQSKNGMQICGVVSLVIAIYLGYHAFV